MKTKNRIFEGLLLIYVLAFIIGTTGATTISVESPAQVSVKKPFTVTISVSEVNNAYYAILLLDFNSSILQVQNLTKGNFLSGDGNTTYWLHGNTTNRFIFVETRAALTGITTLKSKNIVNITFNPIKNGTSTLSLQKVLLADPNKEVIESETINDVVTVGAIRKGDITQDGSLTGADVIKLKRILIGLDSAPEGVDMDVNGDSSITGADVIKLKRIILGLD